MEKYSRNSIAMEQLDVIKISKMFIAVVAMITVYAYLEPIPVSLSVILVLITISLLIYVVSSPLNILLSDRAYRFELIKKLIILRDEQKSYKGLYSVTNQLIQTDNESFELTAKVMLFVKEVNEAWPTEDNTKFFRRLNRYQERLQKIIMLDNKLEEEVARFNPKVDQNDIEIAWLDQKIQDLANEGKQRLEDYVYSD